MKTFIALCGLAAIVAAAPFPTGISAPTGAPVPPHGTGLPPLPSGCFPPFPSNETLGPQPTGAPFPPHGTGLPPLPSGGPPGFPPNGTNDQPPHHPVPYGAALPQPDATGIYKRKAQFEGLSFPGAAAPTGTFSSGSGSSPSFSFPAGGLAQPTGLDGASEAQPSFSVPTGGFGAATGLPGFGQGHGGHEESAAPTGLPGLGSPSAPDENAPPFPTGPAGGPSGIAQPTGLAGGSNGERGWSGKISSPAESTQDAEETEAAGTSAEEEEEEDNQ